MSSSEAVNIQDQFKELRKYYDQSIFEFNLISTILLFVYMPIGFALLVLRLVLFIIINVCIRFVPKLKTNGFFLKLSLFSLGLFVDANEEQPTVSSSTPYSLKLFISNYISCLDYYAIKSKVTNLNYCDNSTNRSLTPSQTTAFQKTFSNFILNTFQTIMFKDELDMSKASNYPLLIFPESLPTNGKYGLLKFSNKHFEMNNSIKADIKPVCVNVSRPILPFSINYIYSNDFVNILLCLFAPITVYKINILNAICKHDNETSEEFAKRVQNLIASKLHIKSSDLEHEQLKQVFTNYQRNLQLQRQTRPVVMNRARSSNSLSFSDISRLALQIKDILPDVSFETIQRHVQQSSSVDIDTIIASILDSNEADSSINTSNQNESLQQVGTSLNSQSSSSSLKQNTSTSSLSNKMKSYEEKKFDLLNEARKRYLAKNPL